MNDESGVSGTNRIHYMPGLLRTENFEMENC